MEKRGPEYETEELSRLDFDGDVVNKLLLAVLGLDRVREVAKNE